MERKLFLNTNVLFCFERESEDWIGEEKVDSQETHANHHRKAIWAGTIWVTCDDFHKMKGWIKFKSVIEM